MKGKRGKNYYQCPLGRCPLAPCPMPHAPCPMPHYPLSTIHYPLTNTYTIQSDLKAQNILAVKGLVE
ncbi:hypothetical protein [Tolypothrix sp. VBCCA 56010]|uniref:hypothetical protein n=1 Tax=Tolypothrix sp. VBCCA 56010 TaxID=3137731 RepID=UPI003D7E9203